MKISKTQLQQIIKEEVEAQILRESVISDMVDAIRDSGEDAWDWIKDNAEAVKDAAASVGETVADFADDVVQGTLNVADKTLDKVKDVTDIGDSSIPSAISRKGGRRRDAEMKRRADWKTAQAEKAEQTQAWLDQYAAEREASDAEHRGRQQRRDAWEKSAEGRAWREKRNQELADFYDQQAGGDGETSSGRRKRKRREKEKEYRVHDTGSGYSAPWAESISRKDLERIIKEELEKALKE
jgi:hypothetical protein